MTSLLPGSTFRGEIKHCFFAAVCSADREKARVAARKFRHILMHILYLSSVNANEETDVSKYVLSRSQKELKKSSEDSTFEVPPSSEFEKPPLLALLSRVGAVCDECVTVARGSNQHES